MENQNKKKFYDIIFLILALIAVVILFPASIIIVNSGNYALGTLMAYIALIILIAVMAYTKYGEYVENHIVGFLFILILHLAQPLLDNIFLPIPSSYSLFWVFPVLFRVL